MCCVCLLVDVLRVCVCVGCAFCVLVFVVCARGVWCVVRLWCGVCCVCVCWWMYVGVNVAVYVEHMRAFYWFTQRRFEPAHGDVLNLHTEASLSLLSFSLSSSSLPSFSFSFSSSLFSSSFSLLSLCSSLFLSVLVSLFKIFSVSSQLSESVLNDNDNDRSSSWLSLYTWL